LRLISCSLEIIRDSYWLGSGIHEIRRMDNEQMKPTGWGDDSLSEFIEKAIHNTYASFDGLKDWYNRFKDIHLVFQHIANNLDRTNDWFASFFLYRSHAAFLAGVRLALSGQVPEAYMVFRGCIENALYGLYISKNSESIKTWLSRHDDKKSKDKVRSEFTIGKLLRFLENENPELFKITLSLYERTIDLGGHPNEQAFLSMIKMTRSESMIKFDSIYLMGNEPPLALCLKSCAQIGINALFVFQIIYKERFDILGLSDKLNMMKQGL